MNKKKKVERNAFGQELERLLLIANIKNSTVAAALNYDVSYISKWTTGKAIPSAKNAERISAVVSGIVIQSGTEDGIETLLSTYGIENRDVLQHALKERLMNAYADASGRFNESQYLNNAVLKIAPKGQYPLLTDYAEAVSKEKGMEIAVMADLFAMDQTSKLKLAGIEDYKFAIKEKNEKIKVDYIINLDSLDGASVYDVLLLIHMMTNFSRTDFKLFYSSIASRKLMVAVKDEFAGVSLMGNGATFLSTTSTRDKKTVSDIYESIKGSVEPDKVIFFSTDMGSLLLSHEYLQTLISQDTRWLIGHVTEHFISPELFGELINECFGDEQQLHKEMERAHVLGKNAIVNNQLRIMIYSSALVDFALTGELDFFNRKIVLTPKQRKRELEYIRGVFSVTDANHIRMLGAGLNDDFKYVTNPCIFLADSLDYLRLENHQYENNLMLIKNERTRKMFDVFFDEIWSYDNSLVISDNKEIIKKIDGLISTVELLMNTEK